MTLKSSLVFEPDTSIEVFLDNIIEVGTTHNREILTYDASDVPEIEEFARNRHPSNTIYQGSIQSDIIEKKRKLIYLNAYADKVIVIDGGNSNATYGNINPLDISDRKKDVADLRFTAVAKGGITGQFYDSDDCTSTGTKTADSDAVNGYADVLDAQGEKVYFDLTQTDYELPAGDYKLFARVKDVLQVADDVKLEVYNTTDASSVASGTFTAAAGYTYVVLDFTTDSTEDGDSIRMSCEKAEVISQNISVDFIGFVKV